ncbi:hypothetical protein EJ03DRAFT_375244 [Teratosphaeria nubilosa]|uniref:Calcofluor white hypersensitive protein n=1 Tax=Teratosphaeria nubilosa TaxID=161662 RepID=A0A6G1L7F3_9PEZI|nr:hypothetical protein EJ03DRAFT_375244 [Teratosphaeria nubilosa]
MSGARFWQITGLAAAGGVGYYLYNAGGDPKVAEKKAEADAAKLSREIKSHLPGTGKEVKKDSEVLAADAGKKFDQTVADAKSGLSKVDAKLDTYRKDAEKSIEQSAHEAKIQANAAIDKFDKSVTEGASKAKSGISSWFGGSK